MKVLHVPFSFFPGPFGGTEIYTDTLIRSLAKSGVEGLVAAMNGQKDAYEYDGIRVRSVPMQTDFDRTEDFYRYDDPVSAAGFGRVFDEERPDVLHLHAMTGNLSFRVVEEAKKRGIPTVFTYHVPSITCQRGSLMRWGAEVCDGKMRTRTCTQCTLQHLGAPMPLALAAGSLPLPLARMALRLGLRGGISTGLGMAYLVNLRHSATRRFFEEADHVVAVAEWVLPVLRLNGVPAEKITLSKHGLPAEDLSPAFQRPPASAGPKKIAFLGRLEPVKGADVLVEALARRPKLGVKLDLYGIIQGEGEADYRRRLSSAIDRDPRVTLHAPVPRAGMIRFLAGYDAVAMPSQWLETGPLVVLEALAAGTPVIGSKLGGIPERMKDPDDGILVEDYASPEAWARALDAFFARPPFRPKTAPRSMDAVAAEMIAVYERVLRKAKR